ncbi:hypothetical protein PPL_12027 [Heterostelium album PN500]|uniref:peptidyl-tRNA hydrolase n=1 Tax=Heterostelium pallidum (strain ATCC 26659 / Pp 5 / PN500) TaxID=670386 RepID=D3BV55_HETP5|nr:hypothetical protein PPL_12027 [Heterostelium album PN500]EFA74993.1 hypothetical protein PPL_12027 [Heterostelium album PN500]|eukprot:XP_020427127.1 hypothetical protein PPL_12027 [Heterostelium album PN500]
MFEEKSISVGTLIVSSALSMMTGAVLSKWLSKPVVAKEPVIEESEDESEDEEYSDSDYDIEEDKSIGACKMVLVVRTDLEMTKGKIAAQCCHATLGSYKRAKRNQKYHKMLKQWEVFGQAKVTLKTNNEKELMDLEKAAKEAGLPHYLVIDAGRTQIASGSRTVLAVGPAPIAAVDSVTKHLKLL